MAYTITIKYIGPTEPDSITFVNPICSCHVPCKSYVDTEAYEDTIYNTNVAGFGRINLMEPFASTSFPFPVPLTQFKLAVVGEDETGDITDANGNVIFTSVDYKKATFTVDTYMEAYWYKEAGAILTEQGFYVTVEEATAA